MESSCTRFHYTKTPGVNSFNCGRQSTAWALLPKLDSRRATLSQRPSLRFATVIRLVPSASSQISQHATVLIGMGTISFAGKSTGKNCPTSRVGFMDYATIYQTNKSRSTGRTHSVPWKSRCWKQCIDAQSVSFTVCPNYRILMRKS